MSLRADLSTLPRAASNNTDGVPPDDSPTFLAPYFQALRERHAAEGERPHAVEGTRFRHSMAGSCARAIAYHALNIPESDPMDLAGIVVTGNGTAKHDEIQDVLTDIIDPETLEVEVPCQVAGFDGSGNGDGLKLVSHGDGTVKRVLWEHKNVGGFAFKMAIGERGAPQGPKRSAIVQAALNALALDADDIVITLMTWEAVSVAVARRKKLSAEGRVSAQWTFPRDVWEPIARAEIERVNGILSLLDEGQLPARKVPETPAGAVIVDPKSGRWEVSKDGELVDTGTAWNCGYCRWQTMCASTPAGRCEAAVIL